MCSEDVADRRISADREQAIIALLDDDNPVVQAAVFEELKRQGSLGVELLRKITRDHNRILATHAQDILHELQGPDTVAEFVKFIRSTSYELETGSLLLNRTVFPEVAPEDVCIPLDGLAQRCRELMVHPSSPMEKCKVLNRVLFHENGFRGNTEYYDDPLNSFLGNVIMRRRGIPISLSILYILVAGRCGLQLEPVGLPGRFLVGCFEGDHPFYIDVFERGGFRTVEELSQMLMRDNIPPRPGFFAPTPVGDVLCRCCRNLMHQYSLKHQPHKAKLFASFVHEFESTYRRQAQR